jgi:hypothetical protein
MDFIFMLTRQDQTVLDCLDVFREIRPAGLRHGRRFREMGCAGVDLLAYRATEADPIALVKAAREGLGADGALICAGSVDSPARIQALKAAGADAFTIGSAAFDGSFSPRKGRLTSQLQDILAAC